MNPAPHQILADSAHPAFGDITDKNTPGEMSPTRCCVSARAADSACARTSACTGVRTTTDSAGTGVRTTATTVTTAPAVTTTPAPSTPRMLCLKWPCAEEELWGTAEAIRMLTTGADILSPKIGLVAPTYTWATQLAQACTAAGVDTTTCLPIPAEARIAQQVFATLALLMDPGQTQPRETLLRLGISTEAQNALVERYRPTRGLSLIRGLGLDRLAPFAHALRHRTGDEDAAALLTLLTRETTVPTMQGLHGVVPIMDYTTLQGSYDWLFFVGCVQGLVSESAFAPTHCGEHALGAASTVVISHFAKIDEATAQTCGLAYRRTKQENGATFALTRQAAAIKSAIPTLPPTEGGQAFLQRLRSENPT